jgi:hypothetical protein
MQRTGNQQRGGDCEKQTQNAWADAQTEYLQWIGLRKWSVPAVMRAQELALSLLALVFG